MNQRRCVWEPGDCIKSEKTIQVTDETIDAIGSSCLSCINKIEASHVRGLLAKSEVIESFCSGKLKFFYQPSG